jgi:hypothetical protein
MNSDFKGKAKKVGQAFTMFSWLIGETFNIYEI